MAAGPALNVRMEVRAAGEAAPSGSPRAGAASNGIALVLHGAVARVVDSRGNPVPVARWGGSRNARLVLTGGSAPASQLNAWRTWLAQGAAGRRTLSLQGLIVAGRFAARGAWVVKWVGPTLNAKGTDVAMEELVLSTESIDTDDGDSGSGDRRDP